MNYNTTHHNRTWFLFLIMAFGLLSTSLHAQDKDRYAIIEKNLRTMALTTTTLNDSVDVSVSDGYLQEFIRGAAIANKINISIEPKLGVTVVNSFTRVKFIDLLLFLVRQYDLDVTITGNIISIAKYNAPPAEVLKQKQKDLSIAYNNHDSTITVDLLNDTLS